MTGFLSPRVQQIRDFLLQRREQIRRIHAGGADGREVVTALSELIDEVVSRLTRAAIEDLSPTSGTSFLAGTSLVALGGYGRMELAPFSDVDLLFLYQPAYRSLAEQISGQLVRDFWDSGLVLGWSLRSIPECLELAKGAIPIHTSLLEARHVLGNSGMTADLCKKVRHPTRGKRCNFFLEAALAERAVEQAKFGSTIHLLEPDLKKSKGGLRDIHLMRWAAQARYGVGQFGRLEIDHLLSFDDAAVLTEAQQFLLRIRNDLHFFAGRAQDVMILDEQVRLAEVFGYRNRSGMLAVEQFMQQFYRHCDALEDVVQRFVARCRTRPFWKRLFHVFSMKRLGSEFILVGNEITPSAGARIARLKSLQWVVKLFVLANQHGASLSVALREDIRSALPTLNDQDLRAASRTFLEMLAEPGHLGRTLHDMHALGVLERLLPEFAHARGLIQFNQYHKYTVDEHILLCVANTESFTKDPSCVGQIYWEIRHKEILHLALLIHDLGKGLDIDHSEAGREIAQSTSQRFGLGTHRRDLLVFLVHQHLLMARLAFRRDISDEKVIAEFARKVGTPEVLKMLFVMTAADIKSVGPEAWTSWKADLLTDLYARTMEVLTGNITVLNAERRAAEVREKVRAALAASLPEPWLHKHLNTMRRQYLLSTPIQRIVEHLHKISTLRAGDVETTAAYDPITRVTGFIVYTFDNISPGLFSKITGVLAAKGLQILSAQITTLQDGVVIDTFEVIDLDFEGEPPPDRLAEVGFTIRQVLLGQRKVESLFTRRYRIGPASKEFPVTHLEPTKVEIDNETSDRFTIIEVFAHDQQGLLYVIAHTIFDLGLSVSVAKVTTHQDQVLDVFYITDLAGNKVTEENRLEFIGKSLMETIDAFELG